MWFFFLNFAQIAVDGAFGMTCMCFPFFYSFPLFQQFHKKCPSALLRIVKNNLNPHIKSKTVNFCVCQHKRKGWKTKSYKRTKRKSNPSNILMGEVKTTWHLIDLTSALSSDNFSFFCPFPFVVIHSKIDDLWFNEGFNIIFSEIEANAEGHVLLNWWKKGKKNGKTHPRHSERTTNTNFAHRNRKKIT